MMKPTPSALHSEAALGPASQRWGTDPETFARLDAEFNFLLDAAAEDWSAKTPAYLGPDREQIDERDAFEVNWYQHAQKLCPDTCPAVFLNPPYSRKTIADWMLKCSEEAARGCTVYALVAFRPETRWYRAVFDSPYLHEERRAIGREKFLDPTTKDYRRNEKTGQISRAGFPNVGLVFRPWARPFPFPAPVYGLTRA